MIRPNPAGLQRRSVLVLAAGAGAALTGGLSGCTVNNPFDSSKTPAAEAVRDLAPDVGVAVEAVALISQAHSEVAALVTGQLLPVTFLALVDAYEAYGQALVGAVPDGVDATATPSASPGPGSAPSSSPTTPPSARATTLHTAAVLHSRLTGFALRAESGPFARLLGSMAAGLSQQLAVLRG